MAVYEYQGLKFDGDHVDVGSRFREQSQQKGATTVTILGYNAENGWYLALTNLSLYITISRHVLNDNWHRM